MRELIFRTWLSTAKEMFYPDTQSSAFRWKEDGQPMEIMQFTGLTDRNGVKIFEGDIVTLRGGKKSKGGERPFYNSQVVFRNNCFTVEDNRTIRLDHAALYACEVIGNIYQHPGLLRSDV